MYFASPEAFAGLAGQLRNEHEIRCLVSPYKESVEAGLNSPEADVTLFERSILAVPFNKQTW